MRALVLTAYNHLEMQEVPEPQIGTNDVLIDVQACGICGSDIHGMDGSSGRRIPPLIMGHEATGTIVATGENVSGWRVGDAVTFDSTVYCGDCAYCRTGDINLCDNRMVLGVSCGDYRRNGAMADYVTVPQHILYRLPEGMKFEHGAMVEPVSIAFHAVRRTQIALNDTAVVVGAGMIGLLVIQALKIAGCGKVIAVDLDAGKLELAKELGADYGIQAGQTDVIAEIMEITKGRGADIAMEVVGNTPAVQTAAKSLRKGGQLTLIGNLSPTVELPLQTVVTRELVLRGSCGSSGEYDACLAMIANGRMNVDALISRLAPLEEGGDWFQRLYKGEQGLMKVILTP